MTLDCLISPVKIRLVLPCYSTAVRRKIPARSQPGIPTEWLGRVMASGMARAISLAGYAARPASVARPNMVGYHCGTLTGQRCGGITPALSGASSATSTIRPAPIARHCSCFKINYFARIPEFLSLACAGRWMKLPANCLSKLPSNGKIAMPSWRSPQFYYIFFAE